jgi:hypothetical protein
VRSELRTSKTVRGFAGECRGGWCQTVMHRWPVSRWLYYHGSPCVLWHLHSWCNSIWGNFLLTLLILTFHHGGHWICEWLSLLFKLLFMSFLWFQGLVHPFSFLSFDYIAFFLSWLLICCWIRFLYSLFVRSPLNSVHSDLWSFQHLWKKIS